MQATISPIALGNFLADQAGPHSFGASRDHIAKRAAEAFPDRKCTVYADPNGGYIAENEEGFSYRGLPPHCFAIGTKLSDAPAFQ